MASQLRITCQKASSDQSEYMVGIFIACQALPLLGAPLLDFNEKAQFAQIRVTGQTKIEPAAESYQGKRAAKIVFAPVPEGVRDYPAIIIEGPALKIRDFSSFEAISLWVKNPGPDDAQLSISIWD